MLTQAPESLAIAVGPSYGIMTIRRP
jgi:hypothetical protein